MIAEDYIQDLLIDTDIVEVIGSYVPLKKKWRLPQRALPLS